MNEQISEGRVKERIDLLKSVSKESFWSVDLLYKDWAIWKEDFKKLSREGSSHRWPELSEKSNDLTSAAGLKKVLDFLMEMECGLDTLYTYAHLRHDEDVSEEVAKSAYASVLGVLHAFSEESSWIHPALLQMPQEILDRLLAAPELLDYKIYLKKIVRLKAHTLPSKEEKLLASAARALETSQKAFSALNNADFQFPDCLDSSGKSHELTLGSYQHYLRGQDPVLRKNAFFQLHEVFKQYENTLTELIQGVVQKHVFYAKVRGYQSSLEASLYPHAVDLSVYHSLVETVRIGLPSLHRYVALRKKLLGGSELHFYDLSVPIIQEVETSMSYEEAVSAIVESLAPLGAEYQEVLRHGLLEGGWVDRYENKRKRSGAYSSGCYKSMPYILMNYKGSFQDVMTLTHEAGHSMHSYYSRENQKYQDSQYPIFLAEVASTFHEELLFFHFLEKAKTLEEKAYLINQKIDAIRATFFRQALFSEFELKIHSLVEKDQPLTPALLKEEYLQLTKDYFGPSLTIDPIVSSEWSRIPHFYYNFYVYQYATGLSAAHMLADGVIHQKNSAKEKYLAFISSGCSKEPVETLREAGVDMSGSFASSSLIAFFDKLVGELETLMEEIKKKDVKR